MRHTPFIFIMRGTALQHVYLQACCIYQGTIDEYLDYFTLGLGTDRRNCTPVTTEDTRSTTSGQIITYSMVQDSWIKRPQNWSLWQKQNHYHHYLSNVNFRWKAMQWMHKAKTHKPTQHLAFLSNQVQLYQPLWVACHTITLGFHCTLVYEGQQNVTG